MSLVHTVDAPFPIATDPGNNAPVSSKARLKAILGVRHLILEGPGGVALQVYAALIASVLIAARTGLKPTKRTYEMIGFHLSGWASADEMAAHLADRRAKEKPS